MKTVLIVAIFAFGILLTSCAGTPAIPPTETLTSTPGQSATPTLLTKAITPTKNLTPSVTRTPRPSSTPTLTPTATVLALKHGPGQTISSSALVGTNLWMIVSGRDTDYLVRWDISSNQIEKFDIWDSNLPFVENNAINISLEQVVTDFSGRTWFRSGGRLISYKQGKWEKVRLSDIGLSGATVQALDVDPAGKLWLGGRAGTSPFLANYNGYSWQIQWLDDMDNIYASLVDQIWFNSTGTLWISTDDGVFRLGNNKITRTTRYIGAYFQNANRTGNPFALIAHHIARFNGEFWQVTKYCDNDCINNSLSAPLSASILDRQGRLWVGSCGAGLLVDDGQTQKRYSMESGLASNCVQSFSLDSSGNMWVHTEQGVSRFDGARWMHYYFSQEDGQPYAEVASQVASPIVQATCIKLPSFKAGDRVVITDYEAAVYDVPRYLTADYYSGQILKYGSLVEIVDGPAIFDGPIMWYIKSKLVTGGYGWVGESSFQKAEIVMPTLEATCGMNWSRLHKGGEAIVIGLSGDPPNRLRSEPASGDNVIGLLYPGTKLRILDGPVCRNGLVYWKVELIECPNQSDPYACSGTQGWTAEGNWSEYWLYPFP
ncbi:MAG: hypothetical protein N2049_01530 [Anaerolineales bacterium]|nr:hypothetical protein [Anaerolineales bacterium]